MRYTIVTACSALVVLGTGGALAQSTGFQGSGITLSYGAFSTEDMGNLDASSVLLEYQGAYNFSPSFGVQFGAGLERLSFNPDFLTIDVNAPKFNAHAYYNVSPDIKVGVYFQDMLVDKVFVSFSGGGGSGSLDPDMALLGYGVEAFARFGQLTVAGYAGSGEVAGDNFSGLELDSFFYGFDATYELSSQISFNAELNASDISVPGLGGLNLDLLTYVVGAEYAVNANVSVLANLQGGRLRIGGGGVDLFGYGIGVDYDLPVSFAGGSDVTFFGRVGTTKITPTFGGSSADVVNYQIGAKWTFGGSGNTDDFFEGATFF